MDRESTVPKRHEGDNEAHTGDGDELVELFAKRLQLRSVQT